MKARIRLLSFLLDGPARREALQGAPDASMTMLVREDGARLLSADVAAAISEGLVEGDEVLRATRPARAWLERHAARATTEPFARQHQRREAAMLEDADGRRPVTVDRHHSPLSRLAHQQRAGGGRWIGEEEVEAGERLARDFEIGALRQRTTSSWDPTPRARSAGRGGQADLGDAAIDARGRLDRARSALGPELFGVAMDICCFAKGVSQVERERRWPPRSAKLLLSVALERLARHYGLRAGMRPV